MDPKPPRPTVVQAERRQQADLPIYVAACPNCHQQRAAAGTGNVACPCGAHLRFEHEEPEQ